MTKNLRWKILIIVGVIALSIFSFYPPGEKVNLGLDLKGGVHLVLRVQTEDALQVETETAADRLREQLKTANIGATVTVASATEFRMDNVPPDQDQAVRTMLAEIEATYSRSPGAGGYTLTMRPNDDAAEHRESAARGCRQPGAPNHRPARQRARRRRAHHRASHSG
jgi:preprotein translocase subunit SecD